MARYRGTLDSALAFLRGHPACICSLSTGNRVKLSRPLPAVDAKVLCQFSGHVRRAMWSIFSDEDEIWGAYIILCALKGSLATMRGATRGAKERAAMAFVDGCDPSLAAELCSALEAQSYGTGCHFASMRDAHVHVIDLLMAWFEDEPSEDVESTEEDEEEPAAEREDEDVDMSAGEDCGESSSEYEVGAESADEGESDEGEDDETEEEDGIDEVAAADIDGNHVEPVADMSPLQVHIHEEIKRLEKSQGMPMDDRARKVLYDAAVEFMDGFVDGMADGDVSILDMMDVTRTRPSLLPNDMPCGELGRLLASAEDDGAIAAALDRVDVACNYDASLGGVSLDDALIAAVAAAMEARPPTLARLFAYPAFASRLARRVAANKSRLLDDIWRMAKGDGVGSRDAWAVGAELVRIIMAYASAPSVAAALAVLGEPIRHDNPTAAAILALINGLEVVG